MPSKGTPIHPVRVNDELWNRAKAKAEERGELLADVIRRALELYADDRHVQPSDRITGWSTAHVATCPECNARYRKSDARYSR